METTKEITRDTTKYTIIYTDDYALILSDEFIENGNFCYDLYGDPGYQNCKFIVRCLRTAKDSYWNNNCKLIVAHRPLTDAIILEGVPLLPKFDKDDSIENLAEIQYFEQSNSFEDLDIVVNPVFDISRYLVTGFIDGYNKAKETYNLTLSKFIDLYVQKSGYGMDMWSKEENAIMTNIAEIIKSFQQQKLPIYFECKIESKYKHIGAVKGIYGSGFRTKNERSGMLKSTTNSQGHTEVIGSYIYNEK